GLCSLAVVWGCHRGGSSDALATVNGKKILSTDVDKYYKQAIAGAPAAPEVDQETSLKLNILSQLIDNEIIMQRAVKLGLVANDEEVDAKLNELKSPYTKEEWDKQLKDKSLTVEDIKDKIRRD